MRTRYASCRLPYPIRTHQCSVHCSHCCRHYLEAMQLDLYDLGPMWEYSRDTLGNLELPFLPHRHPSSDLRAHLQRRCHARHDDIDA